MKIELQYTTGAFSGEIPEGQWRTAKGHYRKVSTARAALDKARRQMQERCGGSAWDSHYRLINAGTLPIRLKARYECYGSYYTHKRAADCCSELILEYDWEPGEPMPHAPFPLGWGAGNSVCPACNALDEAFLQAEYDAEGARQAKAEQDEKRAAGTAFRLPREHNWEWSDNDQEWYCVDCGQIAAGRHPNIEPCLGCGAEVGTEQAYCEECQG